MRRENVKLEKYKLILVDDEEEVRKGVLQKIQWESHGFEVIGEAENGKEALEMIEKSLPDVILTDIKMPFMDGLELAKVIRERYPTVKIIVITGFDEFEYAHKAIKLHVNEYVLKPISAQELIDVLIKVKNQIDEEIAEKENIDALREYYRKSIPILKEKFLTSLLTSTMERGEIKERAESYGLNLNGTAYVSSVLSIDSNSEDLSIKLYEERELLKFAVLNIVEEIIGKHNSGTAFLHNEQVAIITVFRDNDRDTVINKTFSMLEEIRQTVNKFLKVTMTIGVGNICSDIILINRSYQNAVTALDYKIFMGNNRIIWIEDIEPKSLEKIVFDELKEHDLSSAIKVGTEEEIISTIERLFQELTEIKAAFKDYQIYLMEMLTTILKAARSSGVDIDNIFGINENLFAEFYKHNSIEEVQKWFKSISIRIMKHIVKDRYDTSALLVEKAKKYAEENYHEADITINKICDYLHISPTYFSFIFKRETKTTFINYLTQVRMDAAKELLRTTSMKSFEIAEKVGYSEPNYFSYSFKKKFGLSPSEYRNSF
jgi:two-component system response regulator YesN